MKHTKVFKRTAALLLAVAVVFALGACSADSSESLQGNSGSATAGSASEKTSTADEDYDPYADDDFSVPEDFDEERDGVTYGEYEEGFTYYSSAIDSNKEYAVLFPPDYNENTLYPVIYALHGFGGDHSSWSYIGTVYGNMIADGIAEPAIVVMPDMWTSAESYDDCDGWAQRESYDRFIYDLTDSLMPHIEETLPVKTGRENTAVIGLSQGGTESLAIGFIHQDKIGYTASLSAATGVIPTEYYKGTYWNTPIMDDFVIEGESTTPCYLMLAIGSEDPWPEGPEYYDEVLTENGIKHHYYVLDGAEHDRTMWSNGFYNFVRRIFK